MSQLPTAENSLLQASNVLALAGAAATAAMAALLMQRLRSRPNGQRPPLPPGPPAWPILGNLPDMDAGRAHESIMQFCEKYGPIVSYRLGSQLFIAISDYNMAKEMLEDPKFDGRPQAPVFQRQSRGCGILFTEGAIWKQHRRLALKTMRDFGFATIRSAEMVNYQLDEILSTLSTASERGSSIQVLDSFTEATNGVIATLTLGRQFKKNDPELEFVRGAMRRLFTSPAVQGLPFLFPWTDVFVRWLPDTSGNNKVNEDMIAFIDRQVKERERLIGPDDETAPEPECLCDVYILERRRAEAAGDFETFKDMQIIRVVLELFFAGTDTTARTLEWLMLYMAFEQEWQTRVQAEIDREIGNSDSRRPTMQDRSKLNITCAVIEEAYRVISLASFAMFHRATEENTVFYGYSIPTDAHIIPLIYGISRDPSVWLKPNQFYPEHFLSPEGIFTGSGKNIPFSMGRRACVGESLARMEVFLIFSSVMQRFRVRIGAGFEEKRADILRGRIGIFRLPGDYSLMFEAR